MARIMRHVGQDHLGNKVIVIFREIPDDVDHCLVVQSNTLPDMYHDNMMNVVESEEAQQTVNLYEVLNRRVFGDGQHMLNTLHNRGLLKKMSVDQINLLPMPNRQLPLREANAAIGGHAVTQPAPVANPVPEPADPVAAVAVTPEGGEDQVRGQAQSLMEQARLLEADAKRYRDQAYALDPSLKAGGRPPGKNKTSRKKAVADS